MIGFSKDAKLKLVLFIDIRNDGTRILPRGLDFGLLLSEGPGHHDLSHNILIAPLASGDLQWQMEKSAKFGDFKDIATFFLPSDWDMLPAKFVRALTKNGFKYAEQAIEHSGESLKSFLDRSTPGHEVRFCGSYLLVTETSGTSIPAASPKALRRDIDKWL